LHSSDSLPENYLLANTFTLKTGDSQDTTLPDGTPVRIKFIRFLPRVEIGNLDGSGNDEYLITADTVILDEQLPSNELTHLEGNGEAYTRTVYRLAFAVDRKAHNKLKTRLNTILLSTGALIMLILTWNLHHQINKAVQPL